MYWKRPESVPYPNVWLTFMGNQYPDTKPLEYSIQDITEDLFEDVIKHMTRYFLPRENLCSSIGFIEEEKSVEEMQALWRDVLNQRMGLVALATNPETGKQKIAGVNITYVIHKSERNVTYNFEGPIISKTLKSLHDLEEPVDVFEKFNVDTYMCAFGLSVAPQYSGENIGYQLLMARDKLCQASGLTLTVTAFTGPASQHLAYKAGFKKITELNFETYKHHDKIVFPKLKGCMLLMAKEID